MRVIVGIVMVAILAGCNTGPRPFTAEELRALSMAPGSPDNDKIREQWRSHAVMLGWNEGQIKSAGWMNGAVYNKALQSKYIDGWNKLLDADPNGPALREQATPIQTKMGYGEIDNGWSSDWVYWTWGPPSEISKESSPWGMYEIWRYDEHVPPTTGLPHAVFRWVHIRDGAVFWWSEDLDR